MDWSQVSNLRLHGAATGQKNDRSEAYEWKEAERTPQIRVHLLIYFQTNAPENSEKWVEMHESEYLAMPLQQLRRGMAMNWQ